MTFSPIFAIKDFPVTKVSIAKSLGVTIDDNLGWGGDIENIIKNVSSGIGATKWVRHQPHLIPQVTLHLIYAALILPHFNYCNTVWGNCGIALRNKLQKLQNRAACVIAFSNYDADVDLFEFRRWQNLTRLHEIDKAMMVYKSQVGPWILICSRFTTRELAYDLRDSGNKH